MTKEEERKEITLRQHYRNTFLRHPSGRIVFKDLLMKNYFFNDDITKENADLIGKRNAVCQITNMLCCADDPDKTIEAIIEAMDKWPIISKIQEDSNE